ncbi:MAG: biopolymer transporter ExbD [Pseudomonadota bacterium]
MNFKRSYHREDPEINLIPLIDVLLVILIFLMVTTTYARYSELKINLPTATGQASPQKPQSIQVAVDALGNYQINDRNVAAGIEALSAAMAGIAKGNADVVVVINADAKATHQSVINIMEAARRAGLVRITFATQSADN